MRGALLFVLFVASMVVLIQLTTDSPREEPPETLSFGYMPPNLYTSQSLKDAEGNPLELHYTTILGSSLNALLIHVPALGEDHHVSRRTQKHIAALAENHPELSLTHVYINPLGRYGHHYFVNSPANGNVEDLLIKEFIPFISQKIFKQKVPIYLTGHSSGGWSCVWLQLSHPDVFQGCFASSPDPLDFRFFYGSNLYVKHPINFYRNHLGEAQPALRDSPLTIEKYVKQELAEDPTQNEWVAIESAYSQLNSLSQPRTLFERETGTIDLETARQWQRFDARKLLISKFKNPITRSLLQGKLHLYCGDKDDYFLDIPFRSFCKELNLLDPDATCDLIPNRTHSNIYNPSPNSPDGLTLKFWKRIKEDLTK